MKNRITTSSILTCALLVGGATFASTQVPASSRSVVSDDVTQSTVSGIIQSVSEESNSFVLLVEEAPESEAKEITVHVDKNTLFTLDGKLSTMEEAVQAERKAVARIERDIATQVNVTSRKDVS